MRPLPQRLLILAPVLASLAVAGLASAAPRAAAPPKVASGTVTLRTTDDAGACAATPTAVKTPAGVACPTFPLYWSAPKGKDKPVGLVVVFHGHGHNGEQYPAQLAQLATDLKVVAVAVGTAELATTQPNYRGPFEGVDEEARDAAAAIAWAKKTYKVDKTYLLGVSMGGSGLAYFIDAATRAPSATDLDATWVQSFKTLPLAGLVDVEGISNLNETWAEASGFDKVSAAEIEKETGGTPQTAKAAYQARSLGLLPSAEWKATGLPVVAVVHDVNDGLVPYNQTFEARAAVAQAGIPVQGWDVVFKNSCKEGDQTTGTGTITKQIPSFPVDTTEGSLCLAGHANENAPTTPIMQTAVKALATLLTGSTSNSDTVVNGGYPGP